MEGHSNKENTEGTSNNVNDVSYSAEIPNPKSAKPYHNYVEFLSESNTSTTNEHLIGSSYLPFGRNLFHNDAGKSFPLKHIASSSNADYDIIKRVGFWKPNEEREEGIKVETETSENAEGHAEWKADSSVGDKHNAASRLKTMLKAGAAAAAAPSSTLLHKLGSSSSKHKPAKTYDTDRQRRQRISDNLKALHQLLPNPHQEGSQAYILDDIIDYVKYLQLQVKELSGNRSQADSNAIPLVFHEGYGHYIDQQILNEPLEEIMGKLLEEHSGAANQLLESKGLFLMPIALVDELNEAMQMFSGSA